MYQRIYVRERYICEYADGGWGKSLIFQMVSFIEIWLATFSDNETFRKILYFW